MNLKLRHIIRKVIQETLQEKKIGFLKGPEYSEEVVDLLKDSQQISQSALGFEAIVVLVFDSDIL